MTKPTQDLLSGTELAALLEPVSAQREAGEDLDGTLELSAFEAAVHEPEEIGIAGVDQQDLRNWRSLDQQAYGLLERSRDLRIAVQLARIRLHLQGLDGFVPTLCLLSALTERFWSSLYPPADEDGDVTARVNALQELVSRPLLAQLRNVKLATVTGLGAVTIKELVTDPPKAALKTLEALGVETLELKLEQVRTARSMLAALARTVLDRSGVSMRFSMLTGAAGENAGLLDVLDRTLAQLITKLKTADDAARGEAPSDRSAESQGTLTSGSGLRVGADAVRSREDVIATLEIVCTYYERAEPSSPVPLLLRRAQRLVPMDFFAIMRDLARDGLPEVAKVAGIELEPPAPQANDGALGHGGMVSPNELSPYGNPPPYGGPPPYTGH